MKLNDLSYFLATNSNIIFTGNNNYLTSVLSIVKNKKPDSKIVRINSNDFRNSDNLSLLKKEYIKTYNDAKLYAEALFTVFRSRGHGGHYERNEFFIISAKLLMAECIWFLREYKNGIFCDFPHLVRFTMCLPCDYARIFSRHKNSDRRTIYLTTAIENYALDQAVGQVADLNITLAELYDDSVLQLTNNISECYDSVTVLVEDSDSVAMKTITDLLAILKSGVADPEHVKYVEAPESFKNIKFRPEPIGFRPEPNENDIQLLEIVDEDITNLVKSFYDSNDDKDIESELQPIFDQEKTEKPLNDENFIDF